MPSVVAEPHKPRLIARILSGGAVVVLCAPPGFFKGVLAQDAARRLGAAAGVAPRLFRRLEHRTAPHAAIEAVLADEPGVLVIEDIDAIDGRLLAQAIERIDECPALRVIIALNRPGDMPLARISLRDHVDVLDADALRLRPRHVQAVLKASVPAPLRERVAALAGDWPVALDLLARWASATRDFAPGWSDLDIVRECGLGEFIAQEVLPLLTPDACTALQHASLLDAPDAGMLAAIGLDQDRLLAELAFRLRGLVDRRGEVFCLQPALRTWLRGMADPIDAPGRAHLLLVLADHCAERERLGEAAALACMAGESARISVYAERHGALRIWTVHGFPVLKHMLDNALPEDIATSPVLRMMQCIAHLKGGKIQAAQRLFAALAQEVGMIDDAEAAGTLNPLVRDLEVVRVTLLVYGCALERSGDLEMLKRLIAEQADDPAWHTFLATLSCVLHSQRARFDAAFASLIVARAQAKLAASQYNVMFLCMHEASIHLAQGRLKQARTAVAEARRGWQNGFAHDAGFETVLSALAAAIELESGQLASARNSVRRSAYRMPETEAWFDIYFFAYETMLRLVVIDHGIGATVETIEGEVRKLRAQGLFRVADLMIAIGLCLLGEARLHGHAIEVPPHWQLPALKSTASWQEHEMFLLADAYRHHREDRDSSAALAVLDAATARARERGLERSRLRYLLATFAIASATGDASRARAALAAAVDIGTATAMRQIFREAGGPALGAALEALAPDAGPAERGFIDMLLNRLRDRTGASVGALSEREREVLGLLKAGGSDKRVARHLGISEHGVRYHLKSIYKKLGVHDRLAAVAMAHHQGVVTQDYSIR